LESFQIGMERLGAVENVEKQSDDHHLQDGDEELLSDSLGFFGTIVCVMPGADVGQDGSGDDNEERQGGDAEVKNTQDEIVRQEFQEDIQSYDGQKIVEAVFVFNYKSH